jgi:Family of unknown function (DUF6208)
MTHNKLSFLWEIPLALLSFVFYKAMKFIIGNLYTIYLAIAKEKASQWRVLSAENLKSPLSLPVLMTKGPRWNTHAIIGTLGPFAVKESIAIDAEMANRSARSWIAVIYSFPSYETITTIESNKSKTEVKWEEIQLKPGKYSIGLRYYNWRDRVILPEIKVDREVFTTACSVPADVNHFYDNLSEKSNGFYLSLHYYIFTLLRLGKWLPKSLVKTEYLPVGSPDTQFVYGYLNRGQSLKLEIDSSIVKNHDIYLTLYNRSSFPVSWCQIEEENYLTKPIQNHGFYLMRIRAKSTANNSINSQLTHEDSLIQQLKIS